MSPEQVLFAKAVNAVRATGYRDKVAQQIVNTLLKKGALSMVEHIVGHLNVVIGDNEDEYGDYLSGIREQLETDTYVVQLKEAK